MGSLALWPESASCYLLAIRARQLSNCPAPLSGGRGESGHPGSERSMREAGSLQVLFWQKTPSGRTGTEDKARPLMSHGTTLQGGSSRLNTSNMVCIESPAQHFLPLADHAALCQVVSWALGKTLPLCCHSPCGAPGTNHESQHSAMKGSHAVL